VHTHVHADNGLIYIYYSHDSVTTAIHKSVPEMELYISWDI